jgi:IS30 family transposase
MTGIRLCFEERETIRVGIARGWSMREIARQLGRSPSTVSREVARCGGREKYRAYWAQQLACRRARRPKDRKLALCPALAEQVTQGLRQRWSPQQISHRLRQQHPDDASLWVSHETIYQSLFARGCAGLRKELVKSLRSGRTRRRRRGRVRKPKGRMPHMVSILERPDEVEGRAVPGHWEGDLIIGKNSKSQVATLVERSTRNVLLVRLPKDRSATTVRKAILHKVKTLPKELRLSLTWDQGREMSEHELLRRATGMSVYFCDPHSPWQRGSNENMNGLVRQYLPKGTDLSVHSGRKLNKIARELNGRPRQVLGWMTPAEKFAELVATTT